MNKRILFTAGFILTATVAIVAYSAVTTQTLVGTGADGGGDDEGPWLNASNITADDGVPSTSTIDGAGEDSNFLHGTMGGNQFTIPAGTIDGIEFEYEVKADDTDVTEKAIYLIIGGSRVGSNKSTNTAYTTGYVVRNRGGVADTWGLTPSVAQVNATNFGVAVQCFDDGGGRGDKASIDYMKITVTYTPSGGSATNQVRMIL